jgi:hypothetical protein
VLREATLAAERAGGRLDPPLVAVLDEAANVCRIADLPSLYSHLGSRGIPLTMLQSYPQAGSAWGTPAPKTLWSAATIKLLGAVPQPEAVTTWRDVGVVQQLIPGPATGGAPGRRGCARRPGTPPGSPIPRPGRRSAHT